MKHSTVPTKRTPMSSPAKPLEITNEMLRTAAEEAARSYCEMMLALCRVCSSSQWAKPCQRKRTAMEKLLKKEPK